MKEKDRLNDYPEFDGKVVIVTGGSGGIGRASALGFAKRGAKVAIADILVENGYETVEMVKAAGGEAFFSETDISKTDQVASFVDQVVKAYGRLDYAHNNAGIDGAIGPTSEYPEEAWNEIIATNLTGVWLCMKYEIPHMLKQGKGAIVNTASMASFQSLANISGYNASKAGMMAVTQTAAMELATQGIRVNAVCPGAADTPMTVKQAKTMGVPLDEWKKNAAQFAPMQRMALAHEPADAALWLCSDSASFITGIGLLVDGGSTAGWPFG